MTNVYDGPLSLMLLEQLCRDLQARVAVHEQQQPSAPPLWVRYQGLASRLTLVLTAVASAVLSLAEFGSPTLM